MLLLKRNADAGRQHRKRITGKVLSLSLQMAVENRKQGFEGSPSNDLVDSQYSDILVGVQTVPREEVGKADVLRIFAIEGPDVSKDVALEINA